MNPTGNEDKYWCTHAQDLHAMLDILLTGYRELEKHGFEIETAENQIASARKQLDIELRQLERNRELYGRRAASESELDSAGASGGAAEVPRGDAPEVLARLREVADEYLEESPAWGDAPTREIDELELNQLRALGYAIP